MTARENFDSAAKASPPEDASPETHDVHIDNSNRSTTPKSDSFLEYISNHWAERSEDLPEALSVTSYTAARRTALAAVFPGKRLVIHSGAMKQRSNDTFYQYRPHSAFAHLTGWGSESEPGAILVLDPTPNGHEATLYFRERAGRDSDEFFANPEIGEFWIGPRPSLAQVAAALNMNTAPLELFTEMDGELTLENEELTRAASELRLVKDPYELAEMQTAVDATGRGFEDVLAALPKASSQPRGERVIEGVFNQRARLEGNTVGYETIAAAGSHACTLHWIRNDGEVRAGDLLLLDAGVELDSLYTADITRTVPISGTFSPEQRRIYEAVLEAADAARAIVKPGIRFGDIHDEAMKVIERRTREWGFLPNKENDSTAYYRRYMVHGTSHHLGLDVHDCAQARRDLYLDGKLEAGMVFTIEPGLYFQPDDLTVPEQYRGIGVRIEDDIVVTDSGCINLSAGIPRTADDVEAWIAQSQQRT